MTGFGKRLREIRLQKNMSMRDLEKASGVSYSFIGSLEKERYKPSRDTVLQLSNALNTDSSELMLLAGFAPGDIKKSTSRDKKDLKNLLAESEIMFDGIPLDEDDKRRVEDVLTGLFWEAKQMNKRKKKKDKDKE